MTSSSQACGEGCTTKEESYAEMVKRVARGEGSPAELMRHRCAVAEVMYGQRICGTTVQGRALPIAGSGTWFGTAADVNGDGVVKRFAVVEAGLSHPSHTPLHLFPLLEDTLPRLYPRLSCMVTDLTTHLCVLCSASLRTTHDPQHWWRPDAHRIRALVESLVYDCLLPLRAVREVRNYDEALETAAYQLHCMPQWIEGQIPSCFLVG